jgi:hypothetical protein
MECLTVAITVVALAFLALWLVQFVYLMRMPDAAFPGRYDKVLWVVTFLVAGLFAPLVVWLSGVARRRMVVDEGPEPDEESELEEAGPG